ncbi:MAG: hypothetical protein GKR99_06295 [Rhodobacteraceae bacterium]|nr:hypothetical protein [Paracoccaceae bacterium]
MAYCEPNPVTFQRFGSMMVFFGVCFLAISNSRIADWKIAEKLKKASLHEYRGLVLADVIVQFGLIAVGTLVWGYGDLLVCGLHRQNLPVCPR